MSTANPVLAGTRATVVRCRAHAPIRRADLALFAEMLRPVHTDLVPRPLVATRGFKFTDDLHARLACRAKLGALNACGVRAIDATAEPAVADA